MDIIIRIIAYALKGIYGYEALNLLLRILPSRKINFVLRLFGSQIGRRVRIKSPFTIHNADEKNKIYSNLIIGDNSFIGRDCIFDLAGKIILENNVTISHRATLNTHQDPGNSLVSNKSFPKVCGDILIKKGTPIKLIGTRIIGPVTKKLKQPQFSHLVEFVSGLTL